MIGIGQKLAEERIRKSLTLDEIAKATKIRKEFLLAIEKGEYHKLPSSAYVQGFVRNYIEFLGLPERKMLALFRREFDNDKIFKVLPEGFARKDFSLRRNLFGQTALLLTFAFIILLFYVLFQYRYAIINPPLEIYSPKEGFVTSSQIITVSGKTDSNATVFINDQPVSLDNEGKFIKEITIFPAKATIKIKVENRLKRQTIIERHIEVKS